MANVDRLEFFGESVRRIKDLQGYTKGNRLPDRADAYGQKLLAGWTRPDIQTEMDLLYNAFREHFGFKRKELFASIGENADAILTAPRLEYHLTVRLDPQDPDKSVWTQLLLPKDTQIVQEEAFTKVFGTRFDHMNVYWGEPIDLDDVIDELEEDPLPNSKMKLSSEGTFADISVQGLLIHLEKTKLSLTGPKATPATLLKLYVDVQSRMQPKG